MRNSRKKKKRDLRRKARSAERPRMDDIFDAYFPEIKILDRFSDPLAWKVYHNLQWRWVEKIAGGVNNWHGAPPAWYRRDRNRILRARQKAALKKAIQNDYLEELIIPRHIRDIRWLWW